MDSSKGQSGRDTQTVTLGLSEAMRVQPAILSVDPMRQKIRALVLV